MQKKTLSVAILYYSGSHEDDQDTITGVKGIAESLSRTGHRVTKVIVTKKNWRHALMTPGDIVFNFVEDDTWELYGKIANGLERLGRTQVGHDRSGFPYAICKASLKHMLKKKGIATPKFKIFTEHSKTIRPGTMQFPIIIKPSNQHAGIGISQRSVVTTKSAFRHQIKKILAAYQGHVIAEEYVPGREIHVTILGNNTRLIVLPYCEIRFRGKFRKHWTIYTYQAKWDRNTWEYADAWAGAPAVLNKAVANRIKNLSRRAYHALHCRDIARIDMRINKKGMPFIVDVNMNPSINYYDDQDATLASAYALGWTYDQFIERLLAITYKRSSG